MAQKTRPCMACGAPLDFNGDCSTPNCAYNPRDEAKEFEAEHEAGTHEHTGGDFPDGDEPDLSDEEMAELLNDEEDLPDVDDLDGGFEDEREGQGKPEGEAREDAPHTDQDERADDSDKMDLGNDDDLDDSEGDEGDLDEDDSADSEDDRYEDVGADHESDYEADEKGEPESHDENDAEDEKGQLDTTDDLPEPEQKSDETQLSEDEEGPEPSDDAHDLPEDEAEGSESDEDDDLPPRPQGCNGDCQPGDLGDGGEPCPHCTAKKFKESMEQGENEPEEMSEEEIAESWQKFLDDWEKQKPDLDEPEPTPEDPPESEEESLPKCRMCGEPESHLNHGPHPDRHDFLPPEAEEPPEEEMKDEPEDGQKSEPEEADERPKDFKRVATNMTETQEKRFDNIVNRTVKKAKGTFGQTAEDIWIQAKTDGQFEGEELSQTIQIQSRGVTYWITVAAAKEV